MDCAGVAGHLVAYHVGTADNEVAEGVEAHLISCSACVKTYLALKRAADRAEQLERPRSEARARLRADVARAFPPVIDTRETDRASSKPRQPGTVAVLARRIPLYQGVALAAIAAAVALVAPSVLQRVSRQNDGASGAPAIDSSRTKAASLGIY